MAISLKSKILELRAQNLSYRQIAWQLHCTQSIVSYHCKRDNINDIGLRKIKLTDDEIENIKAYRINHTIAETAKCFNISRTTVIKYGSINKLPLSDDERRQHNYQNVKTYRQQLKIKAIAYKGGKCVKCGYDKCVRSMDFHHRNPDEKEFSISQYSNFGWERIKKELDKCDLLCRNCHGEAHEELDKHKTGV